MAFFSLQPHCVVALVCTGTPCSSESEPKEAAIYLMKHYGVQVRYHTDTYHSLPARARADILMRYLMDERVDVIWSMRGGEGTADILPYLELQARLLRQSSSKLLIGFSDFTPLLIYFHQRYAWPVIHGIGARQLPKRTINHLSETMTLNWLRNISDQIEISSLKPLNFSAYVPAKIQGRIVGGNLSLLQISIGDIWQFDVRGKIVLLEEVNEKPYKVIRTLKHLHRIGFFEGVKAILLAGFDFPNLTTVENDTMHRSMLHVFLQFGREISIPLFYTALIGHGQTNYPVPFYADVELVCGEKPLLRICRAPMRG